MARAMILRAPRRHHERFGAHSYRLLGSFCGKVEVLKRNIGGSEQPFIHRAKIRHHSVVCGSGPIAKIFVA